MRDLHTQPTPGACPDEVRDLLPALLHGRLRGAEQAHAEAHLAGCAACAAEYRLLGAARAALTASAPPLDLGAVAAAVRAATAAPPAPTAATAPASLRRPSRWRVARSWRAAAAALVLALGAGAVALPRGSGERAGAVADGGRVPAAAPPPVAVRALPTAVVAAAPSERGEAPAGRGVAPAPVQVAALDAPLGLDTFTDAELDAVLAAVAGDDGGLPGAEPDPALPALEGPGAR